MEITKEHKKFFRFLKEIGVYRQFINYTDSNSSFHGRKNLADYFYSSRKTDLILHAFSWDTTPQGYEFWCIIDKWWREDKGQMPENFKKILDKNNKNK